MNSKGIRSGIRKNRLEMDIVQITSSQLIPATSITKRMSALPVKDIIKKSVSLIKGCTLTGILLEQIYTGKAYR